MYEFSFQISSIYEAKSSCDFAMGKKNEIQTVVCDELYLMKPFSTGVGAGSYTTVRYLFAALAEIMS